MRVNEFSIALHFSVIQFILAKALVSAYLGFPVVVFDSLSWTNIKISACFDLIHIIL